MRSITVTAVFAAALLSVGACSDTPADKANPTTGPGGASASAGASTGATTGPVTGGADRKTVCAAYQKAQGEAEAKLMVVLPKAAEAMGDASKAGPVITELAGVLVNFETSLKAEAARSADAELKAAIEADLATLGKAKTVVAGAGTDIAKALEALQTDEFKAAGEKVKSLCEK